MSNPTVDPQDIIETMKAIYDDLPVMPKQFEDYLTKRKKLARVIKEIQTLMDKNQWSYWRTWDKWNTERYPVFCFECGYPVKVRTEVSVSRKLKKIDCPVCEVIMWDSKHDEA
jgi:hypothetical protein